MSNGYYRTDKGKFPLIHYDASEYWFYCVVGEEMTEININKTVSALFCQHNLLSSLDLPEGFDWVVCHSNNIKQLTIPNSLKTLACDLMDGIEEQYREGMEIRIFQKR